MGRKFRKTPVRLIVGEEWYFGRNIRSIYEIAQIFLLYLYRAVDSSGATLDFLLSARQDAATAKRLLAKALSRANHPMPRVINTDGHSAYPPAIVRLKAEDALDEDCRHRPLHSRSVRDDELNSPIIYSNLRLDYKVATHPLVEAGSSGSLPSKWLSSIATDDPSLR